MSLWDDYESEAQFAKDYPHGVPDGWWTTRTGKKICVDDMTTDHILNCMRLIGEDDPWYWAFKKEMSKRKFNFEKLVSEYDRGEWDMFELITSVWYGKQIYFLQKNGIVYSRYSCNYMKREEAINEFLDSIGNF